MTVRRSILIDDLHRRVSRDAVARTVSANRWLIHSIEGGTVLIAPAGSRVQDLVLSIDVEGPYEVYAGLFSPDGQPTEIGMRVGGSGPFKPVRHPGGEVDCCEVPFGVEDLTGRQIVLRHHLDKRSCICYLRLAPRPQASRPDA